MSDDVQRFELTAVLSVDGVAAANLEAYCERFEAAIAKAIALHPGITEYFVQPDANSVEINVGFRFEGIRREFIEDLVHEVLDEAVAQAAELVGEGGRATREESTLVPA